MGGLEDGIEEKIFHGKGRKGGKKFTPCTIDKQISRGEQTS